MAGRFLPFSPNHDYLQHLVNHDEKMRNKQHLGPLLHPTMPCHILGQALGALPMLWTRRRVSSLGGSDCCPQRCQPRGARNRPRVSLAPPPLHGRAVVDNGSSLVRMDMVCRRPGSLRWSFPPLLLPTPCQSLSSVHLGMEPHSRRQCRSSPALSRFLGGRPIFLKFHGQEAEVLTICTAAS